VAETILITGGAGFIGRYVSRALLDRGDRVVILDSLIEQVHGGKAEPEGMDPRAELIVGDVREDAAVRAALQGVDKVVHLAAEVGVGQSMYAIDRYVSVNDLGTAVLFQELIARPVKRVVVASSMSIYGEGLYRTQDGELVEDAIRQPNAGAPWDPPDAKGCPMIPVPTPESKRPTLASVYAITKHVQERLTLTLAPYYGMEGVALRLWNAYGPGQALSNPLYGRARDLRLAHPQRKPARDLRGRQAAPRLRPCRGRGAGFPAGARQAGGCRAGLQHRQRRRSDGAGGRELWPPRWDDRTSRLRSPARRVRATSGTTSRTSPKARIELGYTPHKDFSEACVNSPNGWLSRRRKIA
jgi:nucleoside-diphosphate-sugar epimerase